MILPWIFGILLAIGGGFLLLTLIVGEIAEGVEGAFEGFDTLLEGLGIDLIPDSLQMGEGEVQKGLGCSSVAAFFTGFGAAGLFASLSGAHTLVSIGAGLLFGLFTGAVYIGLMSFIYRQQADTTIRVNDFVGLRGRATIKSPAGEIGQVALTVRGEMKTYPAVEQNGLALERGDEIEVVSLEGGRLYVKKVQQ